MRGGLLLVEVRGAAGNDLLRHTGGLGLNQSVSGDGSNIAVPCGGAAGLTLECVVNPVLNLNVVGVDEAQDPVVLDLGGNFVCIADGREGREGRVRLRRSSASKAAGILLKPLKKSQNSLTLKQNKITHRWHSRPLGSLAESPDHLPFFLWIGLPSAQFHFIAPVKNLPRCEVGSGPGRNAPTGSSNELES